MKVETPAMDEGDSRRHRKNTSFPFKGKAGMGMGHSVFALTTVMGEARYPAKSGTSSQ